MSKFKVKKIDKKYKGGWTTSNMNAVNAKNVKKFVNKKKL